MSQERKKYTTESLTELGAVDTASRSIKRTDRIDVKCYLCSHVDIAIPLSQVIAKHKVTSHGWRCRECFKKAQSAAASLRTGVKNSFYGKKHTKEAADKRHTGYKEWKNNNPDKVKENAEKARDAFKERYGVDNPMDSLEIRQQHKEVMTSKELVEIFKQNMHKRYESQEERNKTGQKAREYFQSEKGLKQREKTGTLLKERNLNHDSILNLKRINNLLDKVKYTQEEIYQKIMSVHGDEYVLDKTTYKNFHSKARFIDKEHGEHYALVSNVVSGASHPARSTAKSQATSLSRFGFTHHMHSPGMRKKVFSNRDKTKPEKKFEEMLINRGFVYKYEPEGMTKTWDFVIYKDASYEEIVAIVEIDGEFNHSIVSDPFGPKMAGYRDPERFSMIPDNIKYIQVDSTKIELGFKELLKCFKVDYDDWIAEMFNICVSQPFPYPQFTKKRMLRDWKNLKRQSSFLKKSGHPGTSIVNNFHKSIYTSRKMNKPSPVEAWNNPVLLERCIKNRFIYCPSADITSMHIARGFEKNYIAPKVSVFSPHLAKYLLTTYAPDSVVVRDPFSGFSGRMLGAVSLDKSYIGSDIREDVVAESEEIINFLSIGNKATVYQKDIASIVDEEVGEKSVVLTCPPYGLVESWSKKLVNKTEEEWIDLVVSKIKADKYIFVVKNVNKYKHLIKEDIKNRSHFATSSEYVLVGTREEFLN